MLRNNNALWFFVSVGVLASASACGSDGDSGPGGGEQQCSDCAVPPAQPANGVPGDGHGAVLAINLLDLAYETASWKDTGYDIDGQKSTAESTAHCNLAEGAASYVKNDGNNGIDNSFGANIVPVIKLLIPAFTTNTQDAIDEGSFTVILDIKDIGSGSDYVNLPASLYSGGVLGSSPAWDGNDEWPVLCELMNDCKTTGTVQFPEATSTVQFPASYVAGGTWVSGTRRTVHLSLTLQGYSLPLLVNEAVLTAKLSGSPPTAATKGILAGVVEASKLVEDLFAIAGNFQTDLCDRNGTLSKSVENVILRATDIMVDGTQDSSKQCDGISIGLNFAMRAVKLGAVLDKSPPPDDPCGN